MSALQHRWTSLDAACILVSSHTLMKIACDDWPTSAVCGHMGACTQLLMREPHTHTPGVYRHVLAGVWAKSSGPGNRTTLLTTQGCRFRRSLPQQSRLLAVRCVVMVKLNKPPVTRTPLHASLASKGSQNH